MKAEKHMPFGPWESGVQILSWAIMSCVGTCQGSFNQGDLTEVSGASLT